MKTLGILIGSLPKNEKFAGVERLEEAARKRGHDCVRLYEPYLSFRHDGKDVEILHQGFPIPKLDAIVARPNYIEDPSLHAHVPEFLKRTGLRVVNGSPSVALAKNKLAQHARLSELKIPMPAWAIAQNPAEALQAVARIGYPCVVKTAFGTHGIGVFYAADRETLAPIVDYLNVRDGNPVVIETFIAEANRKDLRVLIVGGIVAAAMERTAGDGDIRANAATGGHGSPVVLSPEESRVAIAAAKAFDLDVAGVDILRSKTGPLVIEVNANPGFTELERATGIDVAGAIVEYALR